MTSETQKFLLLALLDRLLNSWWTLVAGVCIGASLAVVALHFTKPVYEAEARIVADVEKLPAEFIRRTVSDDVEIQLRDLRLAVLSDGNLKTVITTAFGTPHSQSHEQALADRIRRNVTLRFSRRTQTISVRYRNQVPEQAAKVANMLAEFFVVENKGLRAASARRVRESIEALTSDSESELEEKKQTLNELLASRPNELESQRFYNEQAIERLQGELEESEKVLRVAKRRLSVLKAQQDARSRVLGPDDAPAAAKGAVVGGKDSQIIQIEQELEELLIKLTENHPDVVAKRLELERHRAALEGGRDTEEISPEAAENPAEPRAQLPVLDIWWTRLQAAKLEVERLESRSQQIRQDIGRYRSYLRNTPVTQQRVDELTTRMQVLEQVHLENQRKIEAAKAGQQLEQEDIANPFEVTSFAATPAVPVSPNRLVFLLAGVAGGLLLFTGPVIARGLLNPSILSEASLGLLADTPLLVAIPLIPTPAIKRLQRRATWRNVGLSVLALSTVAAVAAMQFMDVI